VQPIWKATAVVQVGPLSSDAASDPAVEQAWLIDQKQILTSDPVLREAINKLDQRGIRVFENAQAMRQALAAAMHVEGKAGNITMTYTDVDKERSALVLESMTAAYLVYHLVKDRAANRPDTAKIVQRAAYAPDPVEDLRMAVAGGIFSGSLLLCLILIALLRWYLMRAARVFDGEPNEALAALENPNQWPELPKNADKAG
jgi:hypothetical protein